MPIVYRTQWVKKMSDKFEAAFAKADADGSGSIGKFLILGTFTSVILNRPIPIIPEIRKFLSSWPRLSQ